MADWPYNTARWAQLRKAKLAASPICEYCGQAEASCVDHRKAIKKNGSPWAWENLAASCHSCHSRKTAYQDGGFGNSARPMPVKGCSPDGQPLDPDHWWNEISESEGERTAPPSQRKVSQV